MRTLDGHLSRRAQVRLGRTALVHEEEDGTWTLERDGHPPLALGHSRAEAESALIALHHAARARAEES